MIIAADNLNALNPIVSEALEKLNSAPIQKIACLCEQAGANLIDINPGYLSKKQEDRMAFMIEAVQEVTALGLILDHPNSRVLAKGLAVCRQKPILNALTLEKPKLETILPLAVLHQTPIILLLLDEHSMPPATLEGKISIALELRNRALMAGLKEEMLIFDPLLPHLSWPDASAQIQEVIKTVHLLAGGDLLNFPAKTIVGLSNLRSGQKDRYSFDLEETCLGLLAEAGLSHVLANVFGSSPKEVTMIEEGR